MKRALRELFIRLIDATLGEPPRRLPPVLRSAEELETWTLGDAAEEAAQIRAELEQARRSAYRLARLRSAAGKGKV